MGFLKSIADFVLFRPGTSEISKTKASALGGVVLAVASIWGLEMDPRILQTLGAVLGGGVINGFRDARD